MKKKKKIWAQIFFRSIKDERFAHPRRHGKILMFNKQEETSIRQKHNIITVFSRMLSMFSVFACAD